MSTNVLVVDGTSKTRTETIQMPDDVLRVSVGGIFVDDPDRGIAISADSLRMWISRDTERVDKYRFFGNVSMKDSVRQIRSERLEYNPEEEAATLMQFASGTVTSPDGGIPHTVPPDAPVPRVEVLGVPIAFFGSAFYAAVALVALLAFRSGSDERYGKAPHLVAVGGGASVAYSIYLAGASMSLGAWCLYRSVVLPEPASGYRYVYDLSLSLTLPPRRLYTG